MSPDPKDRPLIGVGAIVLHGDDVLLVQRGKAPKIHEWSIPGGRQRLGETVAETARREVLEEAGIAIEILGFVDVIDFIDGDETAGFRFHYTLIDYAARWVSGDVRAGGDVIDARWVALTELDGYELWSETRRVIRHARKKWPPA